MTKHKAVFLDKDGTLIPDIPYSVDPELITLSDDTVEGLKQLQQQGYLLVIVSNQSGVARSYFEESDLQFVEAKIDVLLAEHGLHLNGFYYCPHHPEGTLARYTFDCNCRKPEPGMLMKAAIDLNIDLTQSWMIGDILNDVEAGNAAGCRSILIDNGNETEWLTGLNRTPDIKASNINEAAAYILSVASHEKQLEHL